MRGFIYRDILVVVALVGWLAGCQSRTPGDRGGSDSMPQLTAVAASAAGFSAQEISAATSLYAIKCAKCHKFYDPMAYSDKDWEMWMSKMSRKAKLKPEQDTLLRRYLGEFRWKTK
jgi:hypothetical protein